MPVSHICCFRAKWVIGCFIVWCSLQVERHAFSADLPAKLVVASHDEEIVRSEVGRKSAGRVKGQSLLVMIDQTRNRQTSGSDLPSDSQLALVRSLSSDDQACGWTDVRNLIPVASIGTDNFAAQLQSASELGVPETIRLQSPDIVRAWKEIESAIVENEKLSQPLAEPYFARAEILTIVKDFDSALRDYLLAAQIASRSGQDLVAYKAYFERLREALDNYDRVPRLPATGLAIGHFAEGIQSYRRSELDVAIRHFSNAIAMENGSPVYWYFRALTFKRQGRDVRAQHDALIGAHLEWKDGKRDKIGWELTYVQGELRRWLERYRLGDPSRQTIR